MHQYHRLALLYMGFIPCIPALLSGFLLVFLSTGEYYQITHLIVAIVFMSLSAIIGQRVIGKATAEQSHKGILKHVFTRLTVVWIVALVVLLMLNMTPLCVGQDNGDGTNTYQLCLVQSVLFAVILSPLVLLLNGISSLIMEKFLDRQRSL